MIPFYHDKSIVLWKIGCALANKAISCIQQNADGNFSSFTKGEKDQMETNNKFTLVIPSSFS